MSFATRDTHRRVVELRDTRPQAVGFNLPPSLRRKYTSNSHTLDLHYANIGDVGIPAVCLDIAEKTVKRLELGWNGITDVGIRTLVTCRNIGYITSLNLERNKIGVGGIRALTSLVSLTSLSLKYCFFTEEQAPHSARALSALTSLTSLDLEGDHVGDSVEALSTLTSLKVLRLRANAISTGIRAFTTLTSLEDLDLCENSVESGGARALSEMTSLKTLDLGSNGLEDDNVLSRLGTSLTSLNLSFNTINNEGARALSTLTSLRLLDLRVNRISNDGIRNLTTLTSLKSLDIRKNFIGDLGAQALSEVTSLESLDLEGNRVGPIGARALLNLTSLTSLNLKMNPMRFTTEGLQALCDKVSTHNRTVRFPIKTLYQIMIEYVVSNRLRCNVADVRRDIDDFYETCKRCEGLCGQKRFHLQPYLFYRKEGAVIPKRLCCRRCVNE